MGFGLLSFVILVAIVLHRKLCDATPVVTLTPGTYSFKSGDQLELSCLVNETVDLFSVTFYQNTTQTIWINNIASCSFFNLIPNDQRNYSIICDPSNTKFTMIKYGLNVSDNQAVWFCRMVSKPGGSCPISNNLCTSSTSTLILQGSDTSGGPNTLTTTLTTRSTFRATWNWNIKASTSSTAVSPANNTSNASTSAKTARPTATTKTSTGTTTTTTITVTSSYLSLTSIFSTTSSATSSTFILTSPTTAEPTATNKTSTGNNGTKSNISDTDVKVIVPAVVAPCGLLIIVAIVFVIFCVRRKARKNILESPDGMAIQDKGNNIDGCKQSFRHGKATDNLDTVYTTPDGFILYPGPAAVSTARTYKDKKYHGVTDQYSRPNPGKHHHQADYIPSTFTSARTYAQKGKTYEGHQPVPNLMATSKLAYDQPASNLMATSRLAYVQTAYYPQTGYYGQSGQDVYYSGGGQHSCGQRSRSHNDHNGRKHQIDYYSQYVMADYGGDITG